MLLCAFFQPSDAIASQHTQTHDLLTRRITITAEPTTLSVADTLTLTIQDQPISRMADALIRDPMGLDWSALRSAIEAALPNGLVLADGPIAMARGPSGRVIEIEPLTPGSFTIPSFELMLTIDSATPLSNPADTTLRMNPMDLVGEALAASGQQDIAAQLKSTTEPITIKVISAFADGETPTLAAMRGIAEPNWLFPWRAVAVIGVMAAAVVLGAWLALAAYLRRRDSRIVTITADAMALRELEAVLASGDLEQGRHRLLLERVSAVLRGYLEDRFRLRAPELTTAEFLREAEANALADRALSIDDRSAIGEFLDRIDLVKYAGAHASGSDAERAIKSVRGFIKRTADPGATLIVQQGRRRFDRPGAAARLLRGLDESHSTPSAGGSGA